MTVLLASRSLAADVATPPVAADTTPAARIAALEQAVSELMKEKGEQWLTEQRATEIRAVVQDVLCDADTRASLQGSGATAGYSDGFFIASPDGNFRLKLNGQLQNRWAYNWLSSRSMANSTVTVTPPGGAFNFNQAGIAKSAYGFEVRRAKLDFTGHVIDPSWQYAVTIAYQQFFGSNTSPASGANTAAGGGISQGDNYAGTFGLENAYIMKKLDNGFSVMVGQFKSPFLREWLVSSKYQLAVERSLVNTMFSTGWTQGVQLNWNNDNIRAMVSYNDGANNANLGSVSGTDVNSNSGVNSGVGFAQWAFTGRAEFMASGNWAQFDKLTSMRGEGSGLLFGVGFNWQRGGQQTFDGGAYVNAVAANANADAQSFSWTLDATCLPRSRRA